jgi:predicted O-methyltransferase YrrM
MPVPLIAKSELDVWPINWLGLHHEYLVGGEMEVIAALVRGAQTMIEIGCRDGRTASVLLHNVPSLQRYVGVDVLPDYEPGLPHQRSELVADPGHHARNDPRFELIIRARGSLDLSARDLPPCDAMFIDGDHSEPAVAHDSELANALLKPGGVVIWHDYVNDHIDDIKRVVDRLYDVEAWPIKAVQGTWLAFCRD